MKFWKAFIKVTLGTVMPREEARASAPEPARAKREEPIMAAPAASAPERIMQDITVPARFEEPRAEILTSAAEAKPRRAPAKKRLKKEEAPAPENSQTIS